MVRSIMSQRTAPRRNKPGRSKPAHKKSRPRKVPDRDELEAHAEERRIPPALLGDHIVTPAEVAAALDLNRTTIWRMVRDGRFPRPITLTPQRIGWRWPTIETWLSEREQHPWKRPAYFERATSAKHSDIHRQTSS